MTDRKIWYVVADLIEPATEPHAVIEINTAVRRGTGCEGTIISLHADRREAEARARELTVEALS